MHLTPKKYRKKQLIISFLGWLMCAPIFALHHDKDHDGEKIQDAKFEHAHQLYHEGDFDLAIQEYEKLLQEQRSDSVAVFKHISFAYAKNDQAALASQYIERYIKQSLDLEFAGHSTFEEIKNAPAYQKVADKYLKKIDFWSILCFNVGCIGLFIALVLNFRKRSDRVANFLMSAFVFQHSIFILHVSLLFSNYWYYLPHSMYSSTIFSFLYGPLIYFYFKRVTVNYQFKKVDVLHLLPTVVLFVGLFPIYSLSGQEKLTLLLQGGTRFSLVLITAGKLISLLVYGALVIRIYFKHIKNNKILSKSQYVWQHNIAVFCLLYIITYSVYGFLILNGLHTGILYQMQVGLMAFLVLYVSYTAFVYPSVFGKLRPVVEKTPQNKYQKSGLTESLSLELKQSLVKLLDQDKIYRDNDITLQKLSVLLDTTRHNTSQIINEHFGLNFFDLINTYRIREAMDILRDEKSKHIIDVAYEVGFNNKVTFNKSFKKFNQITPSEFVKSLVA